MADAQYLKYEEWSPQEATVETLMQAREIVEDYLDEGMTLTLRQLYYQLVARDLIPNETSEYNRLGRIVSRGRRAGYLPWNAIEDRNRFLRRNSHWDRPSSIIYGSASQFRYDLWEDQPLRVEVWIEKAALEGVIEGICNSLDVPHIACRGYMSDTMMWEASRRFRRWAEDHNQYTVILHLGDHDPSGLDMSRDIEERLEEYMAGNITDIRRLALNMDQVNEYDPPPNPAKKTDSRYEGYLDEYGSTSWELDALDPAVLRALIEDNVMGLRDDDQWEESKRKQEEAREELQLLADHYEEVTEYAREELGGSE